ncbi:hypothetical protein GQ600_17920 [Phytophthora cactorum]|nr:hypothetical protein GQ600_17920 [Phytophthora cactorum]
MARVSRFTKVGWSLQEQPCSFCTASQLNCESSPPEPTLWTHAVYTRCTCPQSATCNGIRWMANRIVWLIDINVCFVRILPVERRGLTQCQCATALRDLYVGLVADSWYHECKVKALRAFAGENGFIGTDLYLLQSILMHSLRC